MSFKAKCSINLHVEQAETLEVWPLNNRRHVPGDLPRHIIENKLIDDYRKNRTYHICTPCVARIRAMYPPPQPKTASNSAGAGLEPEEGCANDALEMVCSAIRNNALTLEQRQMLIGAIGSFLRANLNQPRLGNLGSRLTEIQATSYENIWEQVPDGPCKDLISEMASESMDDAAVKSRKMVKALEQLQWLCSRTFISNLCLGESMLLLQYSHSKIASSIFSRNVPSGSHETLRNVVATLRTDQNALPNNDVIIAFDNNQKLMRTYMIKFQGKQTCSVVTAMIALDKGPAERLQFGDRINTALLPSENTKELLFKKYQTFHEHSSTMHREYRQKFIASLLKKIRDECKMDSGLVKDHIDGDYTDGNQCEEFFTYSRVPPVERSVPVVDLDCLDLNPNSYAAVTNVLDAIVELMKDTNRTYIEVVMDGAPFCLAVTLIRNTYVCSVCTATLNITSMDDHKTTHVGENVEYLRKYRQIVIRPGAGHVEMNAVRSILSFFWIPFLKPVAAMMGYSTENALQYAKKGYDHHKSYNMLMVTFAALSSELLFVYVKDCLEKNEEPSYRGFCKWESEHSKENKTFQMALDFAFTTLHSLHLFRCGIRACNDEVTRAARDKLGSLFFISNAPKYQELIAYDTLYLQSVAPKIRTSVGVDSARAKKSPVGEGFDFLMETRNKLYKSFLPKDITPTFQNWLSVSRGASKLLEVRQNAAARLGISVDFNQQRTRKFGLEIFEIRKYIRSLGLLSTPKSAFFSLDKTPVELDHDTLNYVETSAKNQLKYMKGYLDNLKVPLPELTISPKHFPPNCTDIGLIKGTIQSKIQSLKDPWFSFFKKSLKGCKNVEDLLSLHKTILAAIGEQLRNDAEDFDDSFESFGLEMDEIDD